MSSRRDQSRGPRPCEPSSSSWTPEPPLPALLRQRLRHHPQHRPAGAARHGVRQPLRRFPALHAGASRDAHRAGQLPGDAVESGAAMGRVPARARMRSATVPTRPPSRGIAVRRVAARDRARDRIPPLDTWVSTTITRRHHPTRARRLRHTDDRSDTGLLSEGSSSLPSMRP